mgnify:CR=1 FL=1
MKKNCVICDAEFEGHHNRKYCDAKECQAAKKEKARLQSIEYSMRPEIKTKRQEREKREDVKAKKRAYYKRPEVKAARNACNVKRNRELVHNVQYNHTCQSCNKPFTSWRSNSVFCNLTCKDDWWKGKEGNKYRADRKRKGPFELTCEVCSIGFISAKPHKKTCSEECHRIRRRPYDAKYKRESRPAMLVDKTSWYWEPINVIRRRIGQGIRRSLKYKDGKIAKNNTTFELLPYTKEELISHLESQFTDGMSWDNMDEWHIDHIRPVSSFNFTTTECEDFKKCWALDNLQPLWAKDNMSKGNKWDGVVNA